jgi:hypothetical protein
MAIQRTPGTGGVIDLWKNKDGAPSKLATGRWVQGQGKPQGVGKRWRGWYVGDDGRRTREPIPWPQYDQPQTEAVSDW